jgi:hypothetical protein
MVGRSILSEDIGVCKTQMYTSMGFILERMNILGCLEHELYLAGEKGCDIGAWG